MGLVGIFPLLLLLLGGWKIKLVGKDFFRYETRKKSIGFLSKGKHLCRFNAFLASILTYISHQTFCCWPVFGWIYSQKNCNELLLFEKMKKMTTGKEDEKRRRRQTSLTVFVWSIRLCLEHNFSISACVCRLIFYFTFLLHHHHRHHHQKYIPQIIIIIIIIEVTWSSSTSSSYRRIFVVSVVQVWSCL